MSLTTLTIQEPDLPLVLFIGGDSDGVRLPIPAVVSKVKIPKMAKSIPNRLSVIQMTETIRHETYYEMRDATWGYRFFVVSSLNYSDAINLLLAKYPENKPALGVIEERQ